MSMSRHYLHFMFHKYKYKRENMGASESLYVCIVL